jgi:hydrogenase expression/formation protein HypE
MVQVQNSNMNGTISLSHGNGGKQAHDLIRSFFTCEFGMQDPLTDSAVLENKPGKLAFTTDAYVVDPIFFPGGNIGNLAVCGTVNDLAVSGADPLFISASFIIEEGFRMRLLKDIVTSMAEEAKNAGVKIVTGDTKVVGKGKCDGIFITTSGIGIFKDGRSDMGTGKRIAAGDILIINGPVGNHSIAVLGARNNMNFSSPVISDCSCLNEIISRLLDTCGGIKFMRDATRGGLAAVLNELTEMTGFGIQLEEDLVPVDEPVKAICEMLGFDPLYLANEGKMLIVADMKESEKILDLLSFENCGKAAVIGEIISDDRRLVRLKTSVGGSRIIDMPSGLQLPRIC